MDDQKSAAVAPRWDVAPPDVERLEAEWWTRYSWLEDEYAWVHPPGPRHTLRRHYMKRIIDSIPADGIIVDFGCGPGWLAILLAECGARHVIGVDNAPAQIAIAVKKAAEAGQSDRIDFFDTIDPRTLRRADAVVIHGVLHHLSWTEIDALAALLQDNVRETCRIFLLEPVEGTRRYPPWSIPFHLVRLSATWRRQSPRETRIRRLLASRGEGPRHAGHGVSPKEMPFQVGELETRLRPRFIVTRGRPVLFLSVPLVTELLLLGETSPRAAAVLLRAGLPLYMAWERLSFVFAPPDLWRGWVFCLVEARPVAREAARCARVDPVPATHTVGGIA